MFPTERRRRLVEMLQSERSLTVARLAAELRVSEATVRRDLRLLEGEGRLRRSYGGAYLPAALGVEPPLLARRVERMAEKQAIARVAAEMVQDRQVVALDVGTTTFELAKALRRRRNLTVFTNSLPAAEALAGSTHQVYVLGGLLRHQEFSLVGALTRELVGRFHFDVFFLGVAGFDPVAGFSDYSLEDVEVKQAFIAAAHTTVAVVDSSKWGRVALARVAPLDAASTLVTDAGLGPDATRELEGRGLRVVVADVPAAEEEGSIS